MGSTRVSAIWFPVTMKARERRGCTARASRRNREFLLISNFSSRISAQAVGEIRRQKREQGNAKASEGRRAMSSNSKSVASRKGCLRRRAEKEGLRWKRREKEEREGTGLQTYHIYNPRS